MTLERKQLFEREAMQHMSALYGMALKYTHSESEAEDLVQEAMFKAFRSFDSFDEGTNCRAWLFKILTNTFINKYKSNKREKDFKDHIEKIVSGNEKIVFEISKSAERILETDETRTTKNFFYAFPDEIVHAFNTISNEFKTIVIMADIEGLSYKEIADKLHIPLGTVMSRLCRARQILRNILGDYAVSFGYAK